MKTICLLVIVLALGFAEKSYAVNAEAWEMFDPMVNESSVILYLKYDTMRELLKGFQKDLVDYNLNFMKLECIKNNSGKETKEQCINNILEKLSHPTEGVAITLVAPTDKYGVTTITLDKKDKRHIAFFSIDTNNITPTDIVSRYGPLNAKVFTNSNFEKYIKVDFSDSDKFSIPIVPVKNAVLVFSFNKNGTLGSVVRAWDTYAEGMPTKTKKRK
ncbi:MAG: hypothetical protein AB9872_04075 [Solidesulfovibrio sp.]